MIKHENKLSKIKIEIDMIYDENWNLIDTFTDMSSRESANSNKETNEERKAFENKDLNDALNSLNKYIQYLLDEKATPEVQKIKILKN